MERLWLLVRMLVTRVLSSKLTVWLLMLENDVDSSKLESSIARLTSLGLWEKRYKWAKAEPCEILANNPLLRNQGQRNRPRLYYTDSHLYYNSTDAGSTCGALDLSLEVEQ